MKPKELGLNADHDNYRNYVQSLFNGGKSRDQCDRGIIGVP